MLNNQLATHLKCFADFYLFEKDRGRAIAFASIADSIAKLNFKINIDNLKSLEIKGLNSSITHEIKLFLEKKPSDRFLELNNRWPTSSFRSLLNLYNFDLEYVIFLWKTYKSDSLASLKNLKEDRVQVALNMLHNSHSEKNFETLQTSKLSRFPILGSVSQTNTFYNIDAVELFIQQSAKANDKYFFAANFIPSSNNFSDLEGPRLDRWFSNIKKKQIVYNIKIWTGAIVDIDIVGTPLIRQLNKFDFYILNLCTQPHTNKIQRLIKGWNSFKEKEKVFVNFLDQYLLPNEIEAICNSINNLIITSQVFNHSLDLDQLHSKNLLVAPGLFNNNITPLDISDKQAIIQIINYLNLNQSQVVNSHSRPFSKKNTTNTIGIK